eukprot:1136751-Alexandrium_andersonii.AAC.1
MLGGWPRPPPSLPVPQPTGLAPPQAAEKSPARARRQCLRHWATGAASSESKSSANGGMRCRKTSRTDDGGGGGGGDDGGSDDSDLDGGQDGGQDGGHRAAVADWGVQGRRPDHG